MLFNYAHSGSSLGSQNDTNPITSSSAERGYLFKILSRAWPPTERGGEAPRCAVACFMAAVRRCECGCGPCSATLTCPMGMGTVGLGFAIEFKSIARPPCEDPPRLIKPAWLSERPRTVLGLSWACSPRPELTATRCFDSHDTGE